MFSLHFFYVGEFEKAQDPKIYNLQRLTKKSNARKILFWRAVVSMLKLATLTMEKYLKPKKKKENYSFRRAVVSVLRVPT